MLVRGIQDRYGGRDGRVDALQKRAVDRARECSVGGYRAFWQRVGIEPAERKREARRAVELDDLCRLWVVCGVCAVWNWVHEGGERLIEARRVAVSCQGHLRDRDR